MRDEAASRRSLELTEQISLLSAPPPTDAHYESLHAEDFIEATSDILAAVKAVGRTATSVRSGHPPPEKHPSQRENSRPLWLGPEEAGDAPRGKRNAP